MCSVGNISIIMYFCFFKSMFHSSEIIETDVLNESMDTTSRDKTIISHVINTKFI
ncbi:hypothetical protein SDC9_194351 [bioreactor metagenome]|uniref:Uncharacterized protein n=1 Tax=bioreactor metagenome TaxID=1076179 RepID=A0A645IHC3_9ZZZZ